MQTIAEEILLQLVVLHVTQLVVSQTRLSLPCQHLWSGRTPVGAGPDLRRIKLLAGYCIDYCAMVLCYEESIHTFYS